MMKHLADRKFKLIRNAVIIVLALLLVWLLLGVPALTKTQAFRRAMREHFLAPKDPELYLGTDGSLSALAEVGGVYVATGLQKTGIGWEHRKWSETEAVDGVYIITSLITYGGRLKDYPEVAVKAEGENAELNFIYQGETHPLSVVGKQNGWFLFRFEPSPLTEGTSYSLFVSTQEYVRLGLPGGETDCSFVFVSYDAEGREVVRTEKNY